MNKLGTKDLDPKMTYKLTTKQRGKLACAGQSIAKVKEVMTGKEIMEHRQWKTIGELEPIKAVKAEKKTAKDKE